MFDVCMFYDFYWCHFCKKYQNLFCSTEPTSENKATEQKRMFASQHYLRDHEGRRKIVSLFLFLDKFTFSGAPVDERNQLNTNFAAK
jgi:hypothetical protein